MPKQLKKEAAQVKTNKPKVAVYFCNGIGNFLLLTPAIQALGELYDSKIDIVMSSDWNDYRSPIIQEIISNWDLVNKIICFPKDDFDPRKYKLLFTTAHNEDSMASGLFKQKGNKFGHPNWLQESIHELDYYMNEVYKLGYKGKTPKIYISRAAKPILQGNKSRIAIYNGAASLSEFYRWERKKWNKFADLLTEVYNYYKVPIIYLGGRSEQKEGAELARRFSFITNYAGKLKFLESVKALSQCNLLISTDSALMHAAEAVDVPVIALFGSTLLSKNRPYSGKYKIVRGKCKFAPCQYTSRFGACRDYICMNNISVGDVMKAIRQIGVI